MIKGPRHDQPLPVASQECQTKLYVYIDRRLQTALTLVSQRWKLIKLLQFLYQAYTVFSEMMSFINGVQRAVRMGRLQQLRQKERTFTGSQPRTVRRPRDVDCRYLVCQQSSTSRQRERSRLVETSSPCIQVCSYYSGCCVSTCIYQLVNESENSVLHVCLQGLGTQQQMNREDSPHPNHTQQTHPTWVQCA